MSKSSGVQMSLSPLVPPFVPALCFSFPGLRVDIAEYSAGPTGITFFHFPERAYAAVDVRDGSPGTTFTDALRAAYGKFVSGIAFCGGSAYGLEAGYAVAAGLLSSGLASHQRSEIAIVPAAVVFDYKGRDNDVHPDHALALAALHSTREDWFPCGARGAGRFVHCGTYFGQACMEQSGQGAAFGEFGRTKLGIFTVVNALGVVVNREGQPVLGNLDRRSGRRSLVAEDLRRGKKTHPTDLAADAGVSENTTLTLLVTNRQLRQEHLQRLAVATHTSMARAIQPFHTERDGDTFFAVTTAEVSTRDPDLSDLCVLSAELAWDAVLNCAAERFAEVRG
jgi:L-aminopeptidase/D-esterase-like protein